MTLFFSNDFSKRDSLLNAVEYSSGHKVVFFLNNGNNHYSITRSAAITEYLKTACHMFFYTVDL